MNGTKALVSSWPGLAAVQPRTETPEPKYFLHLFQCPSGADLESQVDDSDQIVTLPKPCKKQLVDSLNGSSNYPVAGTKGVKRSLLGPIPEDSPVSDPSLQAGDVTTAEPKGEEDPPDFPEELEGEDNADPDEDEEVENTPPGAVEWEPSPDQLRDLKIAHDNSGHPNNQDFARLLRRGNARPEVARWVRKHFKCAECEAHQRPKARRPAAVPKTYRVNHVVGLDLVEVSNPFGQTKYWLNCVCWGSAFQQVGVVEGNLEAKTAWEASGNPKSSPEESRSEKQEKCKNE